MSSNDETRKLENRKKHIQNNPKLTENAKETILGKYLKHVQRSGASAPGTQTRYLRNIEIILEHHPSIELGQLPAQENKLRTLNEKIVDNIQDSKYKRTNGELTERNKRGQWTAWKRMLQTLGLETGDHKKYVPSPVKFSSNPEKIDTRANTSPQDLPNTRQMKKFLQTLGQASENQTALRNQALILLIWDTGTRKGETLPIKMKQVSVKGNRVKIEVKGNKKSSDRRIEIFQGRQTLKKYIEQHPKKNDPEAYLFYNVRENKYYTELSQHPLRRKIHHARDKADIDFKTLGEPFHIFRKAMTTYYVVNKILSWEEVCERQGKSPDGTMPTYLKMAMEDVDTAAAEGFGLERDLKTESHMKTPPLMPLQCRECGELNKCFHETCSSCGTTLPEAEMPDNLQEADTEEIEKAEIIGEVKAFKNTLQSLGVDIENV